MKECFIVKEYELLNPSINEIYYLVNCANVNCEDNYFHWFVYKCVFNIKFMNTANNKEVVFQVSLRYGEYKTFESDELDVILENIEEKVFIFSQILKLTMKIYSSLSNINLDYYLKLRIPIMHRKVLQKNSQNPEYVKRFCADENIDFHFAFREWTNCM